MVCKEPPEIVPLPEAEVINTPPVVRVPVTATVWSAGSLKRIEVVVPPEANATSVMTLASPERVVAVLGV